MKILLILIISLALTNFTFSQIVSGSIEVSNITNSGMIIKWENEQAQLSFLRYGNTKNLELGTLNSGTTTNPSITITGGDPAQLFYVQAVAQDGGTLYESDTLVFITKSSSTGKIIPYFNNTVDHSFATTGNEAVHLDKLIDDTLVEYIQRAEESIDLAIYNTTSSSSVANYIDALNQAHANGVQVRVIYCASTGNTGIANLDPGVPKLIAPEPDFNNDIGIMHNKFFVFDANSSDPNKPFVWTGSTNLTTQQLNTDPNNVIIIQDQSLARTYQLEFEEMWGGDGPNPDLGNAKFGIEKKNNTPNVLNIADKRVECYFSPSDGTNQRLLDAINEAEDDLIVNTMLITRSDIASAINFMHATGSNVSVAVNSESQSSQFNTLRTSLNGRLAEYTSQTGVLHHKAMIGNVLSGNNPFVLTGSHNWSASAEDRNDENTLIIYDEDIANQYLQEFMARFEPMAGQIKAYDDSFFVENHQIHSIDVSDNDEFYFTIVPEISILTPPHHGIANGTSFGFLNYFSDTGYGGKDSIQYVTCNHTADSYCDTAWLRITFDETLSIGNDSFKEINIFPNPTDNFVNIELPNDKAYHLEISSITGQIKGAYNLTKSSSKIDLNEMNSGVYLFTFTNSNTSFTKRVIVK